MDQLNLGTGKKLSMDRRQVIKLTGLLTGAVVAAPLAASLLSSCNSAPAGRNLGEGLHFFTDEEFAFLGRLLDTILPKTDSPSATEVGVDITTDSMVGTVYPEESKKSYSVGFSNLMNLLANKEDLMTELRTLEKRDPSEEVFQAYLHVKQQAIAYYLSTEKIGKEFLNYVPVPGEYTGCVSLEEVGGKAWAL